MFDVAIIGAGVVGTLTARELTRYNPNSRRNYPIRDEKRLKQAIFSKKT